jgi:hypothetical protein
MGNTSLKVIGAKKEYIRLFREEYSITKTCRRMNISRRRYYHWIEDDPEFAREVDMAREEIIETLEAEAVRRAYTGIEREIYYRDGVIGREREYSDALLILLLKGLRPEKYRERRGVTKKPEDKITVLW